MRRLIIFFAVLLIAGLCIYFSGTHKMIRDAQETFDKAVEVPLEEGQTLIVMDQTAVFGIPEGYEVEGNSYFSNATELSKDGDYITAICFEKPSGETTISVAGWPSDTDETYLGLEEDAGKDPDIEIIKARAGDAYFYYSGTNKDDQPLELAAYIRIGDNTYCVEMENSDDKRVMTGEDIALFKKYVQSIEQYDAEAANELTEEDIAELEARIADQYLEELKKASDERVSEGEEGAELLDCRIESVHVLSDEERQDLIGDSDYYGPNDILAVVDYSVKPKEIESWLPANGEVDGEWIVNKQACVCIPEGSDSIGGLGGTGF